MTGNIGGAGATIAGAVVAPHIAARLITNPRFVRWLSGTRMLSNNPNSLTAHLGRLAAVVEAEPSIRDEVNQYLAALRPAPSTPAQSTTAEPQR